MTIKVFTEAGKEIGYGHVARCCAVSEEFIAKGLNVTLFIHCDIEINSIFNTFSNIVYTDWTDEKEFSKAGISKNDLVIIDSYRASLLIYQDAYNHAGLCVVFDDNSRMPYPGGVVVNGAVAAGSNNYPENEKLKYLLGIKYHPIRKEFMVPLGSKQVNPEVKNILVSLGGSDIHNITIPLIKEIQKKFNKVPINLVATTGYNISEITKQSGNTINLHINISATEMSKLARKCDLAILAAGQTLFEVLLAQTPIIAIGMARNQEINIKGWLQLGLIDFAGWWDDPLLIENLKKMFILWKDINKRQEYHKKTSHFVASLPKNLLVKSLLQLYFQKQVSIITADHTNELDLYQLANDPVVRKNSFSQGKIGLAWHKQWFNTKLKDKNCYFLVVMVNNEFAGQIRYDMDMDTATINLGFVQKYRSKGIGPVAMPMSSVKLKHRFPKINIILAKVKKENVASRILFEKCGYRLTDLTNDIYTFTLDI